MPGAALEGDTTACPMMSPAPHGGGPLVRYNPEKACVLIDGKPVIRLADYGICKNLAVVGGSPVDQVVAGAQTITLCGLPIARIGDRMSHGGSIAQGSPDVILGGPAFVLPSGITLAGTQEFRNNALRDLYKLSTTEAGKKLLERIDTSKKDVTVQQDRSPGGGGASGNAGDTVISYDDGFLGSAVDDQGNDISDPATIVLGHELVHAMHNAEGTNAGKGPDPNGPASEPKIQSEEAKTIGTGSWNGTSPTENALRAELGLARRDNHDGGKKVFRESSIRPGKC